MGLLAVFHAADAGAVVLDVDVVCNPAAGVFETEGRVLRVAHEHSLGSYTFEAVGGSIVDAGWQRVETGAVGAKGFDPKAVVAEF